MPFSAVRDLWLVIKARDEGTRAMRGFARDVRMVGDTVAQANLRAARSAAMNALAQQRLSGATNDTMARTIQHIGAIDRQIAASKTARAALEQHRVSMQRFASSMMGASGALGAVGLGMTAIGVVGVLTMKGFVDAAVDYQKQTALTRTQVDGLRYSTKELGDVGLRVAAAVPVAFQQIQPALFDLFSSLEIGIGDAEKLLTAFSKAAVAGGTDVQSVSRATIGFLNAFHLPLSDVNHLLDVQFQLVQEGIGTYDEWVKRIGLATPSAARYGQSIEMLSAALAASTRMGITAARSTTAVSRAMDAMSNPKAVTALKKLGIQAIDSKGNFRPMIDVLKEFRTALQKIPKADRIAKILEVFKGAGGTIEARRFLQNMLLLPGNIETFEAIYKEMTTTSGSFQSAYEIMANTVAGKSQQLANHWSILKVTAGDALIPMFLRIVGALQAIVTWFNNLSPSTKKLVTNIVILAAVLIGIAGLFTLIVGGIAAFGAVIATAGAGIFIFLGGMAALAAIFAIFVAAVIMAWKKSANFRYLLEDLWYWAKRMYEDALLPAAKGIWNAWKQYMQPAFTALATVIDQKVMPIVRRLTDIFSREFIDTVKEVSNWIKDMLVNAFKFIGDVIRNFVLPAIHDLTEFYYAHEGTIKTLIGWIAEAVKWFLKIAAVVGGILVVIFVGPVVVAFFAVIAAIIALIIAIIKIIEWVKMLIKWFSDFGKHMAFVGAWFMSVWTTVKNFFINTWNTIKNFVINIWNSIRNFLVSAWNNILATVRNTWNSVVGAITSALNRAFGEVTRIIGSIRNFFAGALSWLYQAGANIINGLINGISSKVQAVKNKIGEIAQSILNRLPFSPAKAGPMAGRGNPFYRGQKIVELVAQGMASRMNALSMMSNVLATQAGNLPLNTYGAGGGTTNTQNFTIYTNEINPRRHSEELGFLLAGR